MRIKIESNPIGPLSVIPELPDARLAVLEGLNGIGKTLAVRLLQLCTGQPAYQPNASSWISLCEGLGPFKVSVSDLIGVGEITWRGDSRTWLTDQGWTGPYVNFDEITIDGRPSSVHEVRAILIVHRIAGDEDILSTFAQQAESNAVITNGWTERMVTRNVGPWARLEAALADAIAQLGELDLTRYRQLRNDHDDAKDRLETVKTEALKKQRELSLLQEAFNLHQQLHDLQQRAPGVEEELVEIDDTINNVRRRRDELLTEVAKISAKVVVAEPAKRNLRNAQRTLSRNRTKLSQELNAASAAAQPLGVAPLEGEIQRVIDDSQAKIEELTTQLNNADASPLIRDVLRSITPTLAAVEERGLGDHIAVDDLEMGVQLTITQTQRGMSARIKFLDEQAPLPGLQEISDELRRLKQATEMANEVLSKLSNVRRFERLVSENEQRVSDALAATNPGAADELRRIEADRKRCDDELMQLASRRAALSQQLGSATSGTTIAALQAQLQEALTRAGAEVGTLSEEVSRAEQVYFETQTRLRERQEVANASRRSLLKADSEIEAVTATIADAHDLSWLRSAVGSGKIPRESESIATQVLRIDAIREKLEAVSDRLGEFGIQLVAAREALQSIARVLRGLQPNASRYVPELQDWLGREFSQWFNDQRVRGELLPEATSDISVDVSKTEVIWVEGSQVKSRPLEAFSSGEQAFAYTRARLAVLENEDPHPANRLIVLDEFGSFIAHDRLSKLLAYLRDRADEYPGDQMLVILPLSQDYSAQADSAVGDDAERLNQWIREIQERNYLVRMLRI